MSVTATETGTVLEALGKRRSIKRMRPAPPPRALVERVLDAAVCAPNHYRTQPWRFVVVTGGAREELGNVMAASLLSRLSESGGAEIEARIEKERAKPLRAPVIIAVAAVPSDLPRVQEIEEICAVAAAVQNMLLAAEALGLAAMWRTGDAAREPAVKRFLDLPDRSELIAFVYLGYPDDVPTFERTCEAAPYTTWLGW